MLKSILHKTQHVALNLLSDTMVGRAALKKLVAMGQEKLGCPLALAPAAAGRKLWHISVGEADSELHIQATITAERLEELLSLILDVWVDNKPLSAEDLRPIILSSLQAHAARPTSPKPPPTPQQEPRSQDEPEPEPITTPFKDKLYTTLADFEQSEWVQRMKQPENRQTLLAAFEKWLRSAGKKSPTLKRANLIYNMLRHGKAEVLLTPRNIAILAAVLLYTISPLDCIPDIIPVIGWLDDIGLLTMALAAISPLFLQKKEDIPADMQQELTQELSSISQEQKNAPIDV